ncbi:TPA: HNH endonuclease signature motif containing protein [Serratia odorifera]
MKRKIIGEHISIDDLKNLLNYDELTGEFRWNNHKRMPKGKPAGTSAGSEYDRIMIKGKIFLSHRVAWFYMTGTDPDRLIDHINGNKRDNRFCNLRLADYSQNMMNSKISSINSSGCKGVSWKKSEGKWRAEGKINGKRKHLGYFENITDAIAAYKEFAITHHGEFYLEQQTTTQ